MRQFRNAAERIVYGKFGGLMKAHRALGLKHHSQVQGWCIRGRIPAGDMQQLVLERGRQLPDPVTEADFFWTPEKSPAEEAT